jgi:hypothetical protein
MGYIRHNAIVVTGYGDDIVKAWEAAPEWLRSPLGDVTVNHTRTFLVAPDGSKMWWDTRERGEADRATFRDALREIGGSLEWVEVEYGHDDGHASIRDDAWMRAECAERDFYREKLRALVEAVEERERRGWLALPALEAALSAARGAL